MCDVMRAVRRTVSVQCCQLIADTGHIMTLLLFISTCLTLFVRDGNEIAGSAEKGQFNKTGSNVHRENKYELA